jgi:hypothetical protein
MKLEVKSPMKAKSSGLLPMGMYSDGLGSSVTVAAWMAGRRGEEEAEPMQSRGGPNPIDVFYDKKIVGTTIEHRGGAQIQSHRGASVRSTAERGRNNQQRQASD